MSPEHDDDFLEDDEHEEFASKSIFAAGWFRAVLVLTVLAIVVVVSLPRLLNWFEPSPPPARTAKPADAPAPAVVPAQPPTAPAPAPSPPAPKASPAPAPAPGADAKTAGDKVAEKRTGEKAAASARKQTAERPAVDRAPDKTAATDRNAATDRSAAADRNAVAGKTAKAQEVVARPVAAPAPKTDSGSSGSYWVQLGAFKDQNNADSLANALRTGGFPVEVAQITRGSGDGRGAPQQHELFVAEAGAARVNAALKGRGSAQPVPGGVTVKPAFDLEEAMSISKRLTDQGLKVVIRPAGGATFGSGGATLHVVRAGGYPDRSRAVAARDELSAKGHGAGIVTQGSAK